MNLTLDTVDVFERVPVLFGEWSNEDFESTIASWLSHAATVQRGSTAGTCSWSCAPWAIPRGAISTSLWIRTKPSVWARRCSGQRAEPARLRTACECGVR